MKKKICSLLIAICLFAFVLLSFAACASSNLKYEAMYGDDSYLWSVSGSYGGSTITSLEEIVIPENVLVLPEYIFLDCLSLKKVTLPSSLMIIENNAFSYCSALETVYFHGTLREFRNIELGQGNDYLLDAKIIFIP